MQSLVHYSSAVAMRKFNLLNTKSAFMKNVNLRHSGEVRSFLIQANRVRTNRLALGVRGLFQVKAFLPSTIIIAVVIKYMTFS